MILPFSYDGVKVCKRCQQRLGIEHFYKNKNRKDGYSNECKDCSSERSRKAHTGEKAIKKVAKAKVWKQENPKNTWVSWAVYRAKRRAKVKGVPFDLCTKQLLPLVPDVCPVFGTPFTFIGNVSGGSDTSPSIDRIDPKKGYVIENIAIISVKANAIKSAYTSDDLMKVAKWLKDIENDKT